MFSIKIKPNEIIVDSIVVMIIIVTSVFATAEPLLVITLFIWTVCFIHTLFNLKKNIAFMFFLVSLFVFLLGREICYTYFGLERYYLYLEKYNNLAFMLISISLLCILTGSHLAKEKTTIEQNDSLKKNNYEKPGALCRQICCVVFIVCYVCAIAVVVLQIISVRRGGYLNTYIEASGDAVPAILRYIAAFMRTSVCLFLATKPSKYMFTLVLYEIYAVLTLLTGHRYTFISISMFVLMYIYIRNRLDNKKILRRYIAAVVMLIPVLFIGMNYINAVRVNETYSITNISDGFVDFFDQQGGSINVIKRVGYYADDIKNMHFVSLSNLRTVVFENAIVRKLFGITSLSGNSVEHALQGFSLSHRLSYYEYGDYYLLGHGVGSCYIAELYHDFWIIGVVFGSLLYGYLLRKISTLDFSNCFRDGILLASFDYLILTPRDSFDNIIGGVFNISSIMGLFIIWGFTNQIRLRTDNPLSIR